MNRTALSFLPFSEDDFFEQLHGSVPDVSVPAQLMHMFE